MSPFTAAIVSCSIVACSAEIGIPVMLSADYDWLRAPYIEERLEHEEQEPTLVPLDLPLCVLSTEQ